MSIEKTLQNIFQPYKGILAVDERSASIKKRLEEYNIPSDQSSINRYREILFSTPNIERTISGIILSEETFSNHTTNGVLTRDFLAERDIIIGVKVDNGLEPYKETEGEENLYLTKGIETLKKRCKELRDMDVGFVKWRSVIPVSGFSEPFLRAMAATMAEYADIALKHDLVPIIEPEVLLEGNQEVGETKEALKKTLSAVISALKERGCNIHQCILKTSFVTSGLKREPLSADEVAKETLSTFKEVELDNGKSFFGIAFLSGGIPSKFAIQYVQHIKAAAEQVDSKYRFSTPLTFSYGRALQEPVLTAWQGKEEQSLAAQIIFTQTLQHATKKYKGIEEVPQASDGK